VCEDHSPAGERGRVLRSALSRRRFLGTAAGVAAAAALPAACSNAPAARKAAARTSGAVRDVSVDGKRAYSMAMHVHSSFSEQSGSMDSQLYQANANAVDVLWWTDHDARMESHRYRDVVHFTSLDDETGGMWQGGPWHWVPTPAGPLASGGGGIAEQPSSPNDPVHGGSLHVEALSRNSSPASYGFYADSHPAGWNYRNNLTEQTLEFDVLLRSGWRRGYLELRIDSSFHPATAGRSAGVYSLSYRIVPAGTAAAGRTSYGRLGVITMPVPPGLAAWHTLKITPGDDIAALWPTMDAHDFALWKLTLSAVSTGDTVVGYFDYLQFHRRETGSMALKLQAEMSRKLAVKYPAVTQHQGVEVSQYMPHLNWFGGKVDLPRYGLLKWRHHLDFLGQTVRQIRGAGGLASYNHPFGYGYDPPLPAAVQQRKLTEVAVKMLPGTSEPAALGCDLLEVGYPLRNGVSLENHVGLWDVLSRNGAFLTGNGTTDDHFGQDWLGIQNNWFTSVWTTGTGSESLLTPLAAGRSWCASLADYRGSLDLWVDESVPMGSVSVSSLQTRSLRAHATRLPKGSVLEIVQGPVDYAGLADPTPTSQVIASYPAGQFVDGAVGTALGTGGSSFVRSQLRDARGQIIALSNPVWLLRSEPPQGVPAPRRA
jgi:hypothetical protein